MGSVSNPVHLVIVGAKSAALAVKFLPRATDVRINIGGDVRLSIRVYLLAMGIERGFLRCNSLVVSEGLGRLT